MIRWLLPLTMVGCVALSACGWRLQGTDTIALKLGKVYIEGDTYGIIGNKVRTDIINNGTTVTEDKGEADHILWLGNHESETRTASYDYLVRTAENEIIMETIFEVRTPEGQLIYGPARVFAERVYKYDVQRVTESAAQYDLIVKELQQNIAQQIVRRMSAIDPDYITTSDGTRTLRKQVAPPE